MWDGNHLGGGGGYGNERSVQEVRVWDDSKGSSIRRRQIPWEII